MCAPCANWLNIILTSPRLGSTKKKSCAACFLYREERQALLTERQHHRAVRHQAFLQAYPGRSLDDA